ncbi:hypothetical protein HYU06_04180 [Candidatus Woesearchaeota archaeon]|nr:hypothetical protein [Candidatus Woesearchaeota archaeon]
MVAANALFIPPALNVAVGAAITFAYSVFNALAGKRKEEKEKQKKENKFGYDAQKQYENQLGGLVPNAA